LEKHSKLPRSAMHMKNGKCRMDTHLHKSRNIHVDTNLIQSSQTFAIELIGLEDAYSRFEIPGMHLTEERAAKSLQF
jgi:hypothetical protein